ncbi:MAG: radical SAM family heme chaperone HemW [Bacillota bacterium]
MTGSNTERHSGIGIYIHIPFCRSKCYYCDFNSYPGMEHLAGSYFEALFTEIALRARSIRGRRVKSIFIGGGTPSLVDPDYIARLMEVCAKLLELDNVVEITMESNPGMLSFESLKKYRAAGINRLSIGLQAWQDRLLKDMGRIHRRRHFIDNFNAACEAGFENINVDLIFGLPGQAFEDWAETLEAVLSLRGRSRGLTHVSCYSLSIEEGTVFGERMKQGALAAADEELDRLMYRHAVETLSRNGYRHYEISNFALPGFECRHNLIYWKAMEYAGFGAGAHSFLDGVRFSNKADVRQYIDAVDRLAGGGKDGGNTAGTGGGNCGMSGGNATGHGSAGGRGDGAAHACLCNMAGVETGLFEDIRVIGRREAMSEYMILGLRLTDGVSPDEFEERFGEQLQDVYGSQLEKLAGKGLLERVDRNGVRYRLTRRGLDFANQAFMEFI